MADPLSVASAWVITTVTTAAIDAAQNFAKQQAENFYNEYFVEKAASEVLTNLCSNLRRVQLIRMI
jgi:hypothetical protein